jgi:uncharacterized protein YhaN
MYISGFHIDGFGIYHDQGLQDLPGGLVLFVGENESGKTTLMEFLRIMLFGFPRRAAKGNDYEPRRGGSHGGRLQMVMRDGRRFTIARPGRQPATLSQGDGAILQADPATYLLGGLDRDTFKHVFAVGLKELQGLEVLSREGVRGRLFAAGAGLGSASVPEVMERLKKESETLLKKGGRVQRLNLLLSELKRVDARIRELQGQATAYAEGQRQREGLEAQVAANRLEAGELQRRLNRLAALEQARQPWADRNRLREKAEAFAYARNFPVNGLERLERIEPEGDGIRQSSAIKAAEVARLEAELGRLSVDAATLARQEAIEALASEREKLVTESDRQPEARSDLDQAHSEFLRKLRELGPAWDAARLAAVDTSVQVRQRVAEFGRTLQAAERRCEMVRALERAKAEAEAAARRQADAAAQMAKDLPPPPLADPQELAWRQEAGRRLRVWWHRRDVLGEKLQARLGERDAADARIEALQGQLAEPPASLPGWLTLPWLLVGAGLGGWFIWRRDYLTGGLIAGTGLALAGLFFFLSRRQAGAEQRRHGILEAELAQVNGHRGDLAAAISGLEEQIRAADAEIGAAARVMGREPPRDAMVLEEIASALEEAAARLRDWQARDQEHRQAREQLAQAEARRQEAQAEVELAAGGLARLQEEWAGWLAPRGFSSSVRPEGFETVLQAVENARDAGRVLEERRRRLEAIDAYLIEARNRIGQVLEGCGCSPRGAEPGVEDLDALRRSLGAALAARQRQQDLTGKLADAKTALEILEGRQGELDQEAQELLAAAGATDPEDFRRRGADFQEWRSLSQQAEAEDTALRRMAGTPEAQAALEAALSRTDPLELQEEQARHTARLQALIEAISRDDQAIGDLKGRLQAMEQDEQLGDLLFQQRSLKEQLAEAARRWATLTLCRHLLEEARGVYERERQPQVIQEADRFLHTMAHGRYRLLAGMGEDGVHLEDRALARKEELAWSSGLADQVYLAVRLGLAREFGRHSEPLPVILDDVLVKFDIPRRRNTAEIILEYAREQQVLLFSCTPEILDAIAAVHQEPRYRETAVAAYAIADGEISRVKFGPDISS